MFGYGFIFDCKLLILLLFIFLFLFSLLIFSVLLGWVGAQCDAVRQIVLIVQSEFC